MQVHKHPVPEAFARDARVKAADYDAMYRESLRDPEGFWARIAKRIDWMRFPTRIKDVSFNLSDFRVRWFEDGELNVSVNCLDRQLATRELLALLRSEAPSLYDIAQVVGKWVWVQFSEKQPPEVTSVLAQLG